MKDCSEVAVLEFKGHQCLPVGLCHCTPEMLDAAADAAAAVASAAADANLMLWLVAYWCG